MTKTERERLTRLLWAIHQWQQDEEMPRFLLLSESGLPPDRWPQLDVEREDDEPTIIRKAIAVLN